MNEKAFVRLKLGNPYVIAISISFNVVQRLHFRGRYRFSVVCDVY